MNQADIAIVLPAFNEEKTIAATIRSFHQACPTAKIYVIDNNSSDSTQKITQETFAALKCNGTLISEPRQGKGQAIRTAFRVIQEDIIVMSDADLTYPAHEIDKLITPILNNEADMVVGNRHEADCYKKENKRLFHFFGNRLVKNLVNKLFHAHLQDIMSGFRAFNNRFIKNYPILVEGFQLETDMTIFALDRRFIIKEVPIQYKDRPAESFSKVNTIQDGLKILGTIVKIFRYYRPLSLFSLIATLFALLGFVAGYPVLTEFAKTGMITHLPLAILAASLEVIAVVSGFSGLILDAIAYQNKIDFEQKINLQIASNRVE